MRGRIDGQAPLLHTFSVEDPIRPDHPLRDVKRRADRILDALSPKFAAAYATTGRPSVPPERLLKAQLILALYSIRSERQLCERTDTDLLFPWFLNLQPGDDAFGPAVFSLNRKRLDDGELKRAFFDAVVAEALAAGLCSDHFSVDGTLIESFASAKSFRPIPATPTGNRRVARDSPRVAAGRHRHRPQITTASSRVTRRSISTARSGRTRLTEARPTRRRGCTVRVWGRRRSCRTWTTR